jgi:signal transduction histidine kinase
MFKRIHNEGYPGSGVGLAITRQIVEQHGGRIWVESQPGLGATFLFSLPREGGAHR